jgi:hypothetical protein
MRAGTFTVVLLLAASPRPAAGDEPPPPSFAPASSVGPTWYGWQTLMADAADLGLLLVALETSNGSGSDGNSGSHAAAALGAAFFIAPAPLIHLAHGQGARAGISFGLRLGLPLLLGGIGMITGQGSCGNASPPPSSGSLDLSGLQCVGAAVQGAVIGGAVGMGFTVLVDASALAWAPRDAAAPATPVTRGPAVHWAPTAGVAYDLGHRAAPTVGMGGTF